MRIFFHLHDAILKEVTGFSGNYFYASPSLHHRILRVAFELNQTNTYEKVKHIIDHLRKKLDQQGILVKFNKSELSF